MFIRHETLDRIPFHCIICASKKVDSGKSVEFHHYYILDLDKNISKNIFVASSIYGFETKYYILSSNPDDSPQEITDDIFSLFAKIRNVRPIHVKDEKNIQAFLSQYSDDYVIDSKKV